ncbi:MAG: hypothetical protein ACYCUV_12830 [Phycisphaerae bacterium]
MAMPDTATWSRVNSRIQTTAAAVRSPIKKFGLLPHSAAADYALVMVAPRLAWT